MYNNFKVGDKVKLEGKRYRVIFRGINAVVLRGKKGNDVIVSSNYFDESRGSSFRKRGMTMLNVKTGYLIYEEKENQVYFVDRELTKIEKDWRKNFKNYHKYYRYMHVGTPLVIKIGHSWYNFKVEIEFVNSQARWFGLVFDKNGEYLGNRYNLENQLVKY